MFEYYSLYIVAILINSVNTVFLFKKIQLAAGATLWANTVFLIINGIVSAIVPALILIVRGEDLQLTPYSFWVSIIIVSCSALDTIARMKAYSKGKIATVNVLGSIGPIILSCAWGILVLHETLSILGAIAIGIMLLSAVLIRDEENDRTVKGLLWLYITVIVASSAVSILSKQHQVEKRFTTVDPLSFSIWIGLIRTVLFTVVAAVHLTRLGTGTVHFPKTAVIYSAAFSAVSAGCYIITLITGAVLPIVITSPLGTGLSIIMCTLLPWLIYREKLNKKQIAGVCCSLIGAILFLVG